MEIDMEHYNKFLPPQPWKVTHNSWEITTVYDAAGVPIIECRIHPDVEESTQDKYEVIMDTVAALCKDAPILLKANAALKAMLRELEWARVDERLPTGVEIMSCPVCRIREFGDEHQDLGRGQHYKECRLAKLLEE